MEKKTILTLDQRYGPWREQHLELFEDEIRLVYRSGANRSSRTVPVDWIDRNESEAVLHPGWTTPLFVAALLAAGGFLAAGLERGVPWTALSAASSALAALVAALHVVRARPAVYFYHAFTGEFLFALLREVPGREEVAGFVAALQEQGRRKLERAKMEAELPSVAAEIHHLARLREKRVISDDEFRAKKDELIEDLLRE